MFLLAKMADFNNKTDVSNSTLSNSGEALDSFSTIQPSVEDKERAEQYKEKANEFFKQAKYKQAIEYYTMAIEANPFSAIYYANRSFAQFKCEFYGLALSDSTNAIKIDRNYVKAYYRRASAYMALGKFKLALKDFEAVVKVRPADKDAQTKYKECQKVVFQLSFQSAIASNDAPPKSVADEINLDAIMVEADYDGPHLDDGKVSAQFMIQLMETYKNQKKLHQKYAYKMLIDIKEFLMRRPNMVDISIPTGNKFTVCGDIHGQFYDLMNIFEINGIPAEDNPYLFNGDFVDRGSFSVECIFTLFGFMLLYPNQLFMSRGNHETTTMNQMYGFEGEVKSKYSQRMVELFTEVYNWLPLCHLINKQVLVMHGGLFEKDGVLLDDIQAVDRNRQPPEEGIMCDLLWADPQPSYGRSRSKRGTSIQFGPDVTKRFLADNKLKYIVRSHEVKPDGYEVCHDGQCITVFSAPNYCDTMGNKGAFITLQSDDLKPKFTTYDAVPHPNVKPMTYASSLLSVFQGLL